MARDERRRITVQDAYDKAAADWNELQKLREQIKMARWLARQTLDCLPVKRDWLDPDVEAGLKALAEIENG
jgi:hypothetical protein